MSYKGAAMKAFSAHMPVFWFESTAVFFVDVLKKYRASSIMPGFFAFPDFAVTADKRKTPHGGMVFLYN